MSSSPPFFTEMTVAEWQAYLIERAATTMAHFIGTTDPERLSWTPAVDGGPHTRSVLQQTAECVSINRRFASLLRGDSLAQSDEPHFEDAATAQQELIASGQELAQAVRDAGTDALGREYSTRMGPLSGAVLFELPLTNMHYHSGQINMIQLLYGDEEFHVPPKFL